MADILLIEDDDLLRGVLAKTLAHAGHEVIEARDGRQGLELSRVARVNLVITDLIMPGQEGLETIMALRREQPKMPVIAISGGANHTKLYLDIAAKIGARRVLQKPFTPQRLMEVVAEVLKDETSRENSPK